MPFFLCAGAENRPRLSPHQFGSVWAPPHGSLLLELARSGVRFSAPRRNDAPLGLRLAVLTDHCAGAENRTRASTLGRSRPATKPHPRIFSPKKIRIEI